MFRLVYMRVNSNLHSQTRTTNPDSSLENQPASDVLHVLRDLAATHATN